MHPSFRAEKDQYRCLRVDSANKPLFFTCSGRRPWASACDVLLIRGLSPEKQKRPLAHSSSRKNTRQDQGPKRNLGQIDKHRIFF